MTRALALRVVRQSQLAEEIVQEAFLALWRNPDGYDERRGSVRAWLMGMVHRRAVDAVRREEAHRRRAEDMVAATNLAALEAALASHGPDCAECRRLEVGFAETAGRLTFSLTPLHVETPTRTGSSRSPRPHPPTARPR